MIDIVRSWAGGLAFSDNTSINVQALPMTMTCPRCYEKFDDFDNAPRRMEPGRIVSFDLAIYFRDLATTPRWTDAATLQPSDRNLIYALDPIFDGAWYWLGLKHTRANSQGREAWFETSVAGTFFVLDKNGCWGWNDFTQTAVADGFEFLGQVNPTLFHVYAKWLAPGERARLPPSPSDKFRLIAAFREGWNFTDHLNRTADIVDEAKSRGQLAILTHPRDNFGVPLARSWEVGMQLFADDPLSNVVSLLEPLIGALYFVPRLHDPYGPTATLTFEPMVSGSLLAWYVFHGKNYDNSGGVFTLDDDPSGGWSYLGPAYVFCFIDSSQDTFEAPVYFKRVVAGTVEQYTPPTISTTRHQRWNGGLAFTPNTSLSAFEAPVSFGGAFNMDEVDVIGVPFLADSSMRVDRLWAM